MQKREFHSPQLYTFDFFRKSVNRGTSNCRKFVKSNISSFVPCTELLMEWFSKKCSKKRLLLNFKLTISQTTRWIFSIRVSFQRCSFTCRGFSIWFVSGLVSRLESLIDQISNEVCQEVLEKLFFLELKTHFSHTTYWIFSIRIHSKYPHVQVFPLVFPPVSFPASKAW